MAKFLNNGIVAKFTVGGTDILSGWSVKEVTSSGITIDQQEVTGTINNGFKEFVQSLADAGDVTVVVFFDPTKDPIPASFDGGASIRAGAEGTLSLEYYETKGQSATSIEFFSCDANLNTLGDISGGLGTVVTSNFKFKLSGKPTIG